MKRNVGLAAGAILVFFIWGISFAQQTPKQTPQQAPQEEGKVKQSQEKKSQEKSGMIEPSRGLGSKEKRIGKLSVFSEPPNLEVVVDGEKIGETPVAVEIEPGEHTLSIKDAEKKVIVLPGESLRLSLFKGEFIVLPEEEEKPLAIFPEPQVSSPAEEPKEKPPEVERREKGQTNPFYWPQNPRGPIY